MERPAGIIQFVKVSELGEFGLIGLVTRIVDEAGVGAGASPDLLIGIGDDAAVWKENHRAQVGTTDMLVQGVHFTLETISWQDLGWKSLAVNISDVAAMGGLPTYAMISLGLPADTLVEDIADLYRGMARICRQFNTTIVGGNLTETPVVIISPTVIGTVERDRILTRSAARPGDKIAVTGCLGASSAGLKIMREKITLDPETSALLEEAHRRPTPRVAQGQLLAQQGVRAAIDISDGLIADLGHICEASRVQARVYADDVPIHPAVERAFGGDALKLAVVGGEDYELLFTAPDEVIGDLRKSWKAAFPPFTVIGEIGEGIHGKVLLLNGDGKEIELHKGGWEHFRHSR